MKSKKLNSLIFILIFSLISCSDWLEVEPKERVKSDVNFDDETGFKDALTGVYLLMTKKELYGCEMTFGMVDILGKQFTQFNSFSTRYALSQYDYTNSYSAALFDETWVKMYNVIANVNNIIENLEKAEKGMFYDDNYNIIRGEVYGLRAFIHFDILRLFGDSPLATTKTGIPYVTSLSKDVTPISNLEEVIVKILEDLEIAEEALKNDPIKESNENIAITTNYLDNRFYKFNYYAIKLLQARIHLYMSNVDEALKAAEEIIDYSHFTWTPSSEIMTGTDDDRNRVFTQELIFTLNISRAIMTENIKPLSESSGIHKSNVQYGTVYEIEKANYSSDYRYMYLTVLENGYYRYSTKLDQTYRYENTRYGKMPLMRLSEAYYIAAECHLRKSNKSKAIEYLDIVREHRNIFDLLDTDLSVNEVQHEIFKEYAKEFICEGQLFYYYKRLNSKEIVFHLGDMEESDYRIPMPDAEIEYGDRNNNN